MEVYIVASVGARVAAQYLRTELGIPDWLGALNGLSFLSV